MKEEEPQLVGERKMLWLAIYQKLSLDRQYWSEMWKGKVSRSLEATSLLCILRPALQHFSPPLIDTKVVCQNYQMSICVFCLFLCALLQKRKLSDHSYYFPLCLFALAMLYCQVPLMLPFKLYSEILTCAAGIIQSYKNNTHPNSTHP